MAACSGPLAEEGTCAALACAEHDAQPLPRAANGTAMHVLPACAPCLRAADLLALLARREAVVSELLELNGLGRVVGQLAGGDAALTASLLRVVCYMASDSRALLEFYQVRAALSLRAQLASLRLCARGGDGQRSHRTVCVRACARRRARSPCSCRWWRRRCARPAWGRGRARRGAWGSPRRASPTCRCALCAVPARYLSPEPPIQTVAGATLAWRSGCGAVGVHGADAHQRGRRALGGGAHGQRHRAAGAPPAGHAAAQHRCPGALVVQVQRSSRRLAAPRFTAHSAIRALSVQTRARRTGRPRSYRGCTPTCCGRCASSSPSSATARSG